MSLPVKAPRRPRRKRLAGMGSIYEDTQRGGYRGSITLGFGQDSRQIRQYFRGRTRAEVQTKIDGARQQRSRPDVPYDDTLTVAQWLGEWLPTIEKRRSPMTYQSYASIVRDHLLPRLGHLRLVALSPDDVEHLLDDRLAANLAPKTVSNIRGVLRSALSAAQRRRRVRDNVAAQTEPIARPRRKPPALSPAEALAIAKALEGHLLEPLFIAVMGVGLRISEALGLVWSDFDAVTGRLQVSYQVQRIKGEWKRRELKTEASEGAMVLPAFAVELLVQHRQRQAAQRESAAWVGSSWDLIFTSRTGQPLHRGHVWEYWDRLLKRAELPHLRVHDLRKACGALLLARGTDLAVISAVLRHASIRTTADLYAGVSEELKAQAAQLMDTIMRGQLRSAPCAGSCPCSCHFRENGVSTR